MDMKHAIDRLLRIRRGENFKEVYCPLPPGRKRRTKALKTAATEQYYHDLHVIAYVVVGACDRK